jgi:ATP-dependent DNA helicase DinG
VGQLDMAGRVAAALDRRETVVIEAGTGTGKTFAYLVPALLSGRHVIISTGTRTLQDQLFHRDLPTLSAALGRPVEVALLKGRANYLCRHRLKLARATPELPLEAERGESEPTRGRKQAPIARESVLQRIERWALETRTGDTSELSGVADNHPVWSAVTSTRENCLGSECGEFNRCHVVAARRAAQQADIVVVNHHLLLADLALKEEGFGDLLPGTEAVILDEAHQVPEIAAHFFGVSFSGRQLQAFLRDARAELAAAQVVATELDAALVRVEQLHEELRRALPRRPARLDWRALGGSAQEALDELLLQLDTLQYALAAIDQGTAFEHCARRAAELHDRCNVLCSGTDELGVRWVDVSPRSWTLQFTPFEVSDRLQQWMQSTACAWILTSATLAVGEDFSHFLARIGAEDAHALRIESPFDYARQALLYLPDGLPDPGVPGYTREVIDAAFPLIEAAGGRAFILFTSYRALEEGSAHLHRRLGESPPFPLLVQGEGSRDLLLRQFRELGNAVLLGTGSFWEGVDVKGEALSLVVIDKLPFASPEDPVLKARLEGIRRSGGNPFADYQLPQAVLALKQGVGRLIRDEDDYGVVMLCDPRLASKSYGRVFLDSLPPMPATREPREAIQFLESHLYGRRHRRRERA